MSVNQSESLGDQDFDMFKRKIKASYGLDLDAYKRPQNGAPLTRKYGKVRRADIPAVLHAD